MEQILSGLIETGWQSACVFISMSDRSHSNSWLLLNGHAEKPAANWLPTYGCKLWPVCSCERAINLSKHNSSARSLLYQLSDVSTPLGQCVPGMNDYRLQIFYSFHTHGLSSDSHLSLAPSPTRQECHNQMFKSTFYNSRNLKKKRGQRGGIKLWVLL